jgi:hypothetical protein
MLRELRDKLGAKSRFGASLGSALSQFGVRVRKLGTV